MQHCNRSLFANLELLTTMLAEINYPFSVIGLSEIKTKEKGNVINTSLPGYTFVQKPSLSEAGGVGVFIRENLQFTVISDHSDNCHESLWIEINNGSKQNIVCGIVYRHPNTDLESFTNSLYNLLEKISKNNKVRVWMGDININLINSDTLKDTEDFVNTLASYSFQPKILQPTDHSATLNDNIFFNSYLHNTIGGNFLYDLTDHLPNFLIINKLIEPHPSHIIYKRDFSLYNEAAVFDGLREINWQVQFSQHDDVNEIFDSFLNNITPIIDKHIPLVKLSRKEAKFKSKPWITKGIKKSIQIKNMLFKKYLKGRNKEIYSKYKIYRNKLKHLILISKRKHYEDYFAKNVKNAKQIWKVVIRK